MEWHKRFVQQAAWTRELRLYLFKRAGMPVARRVLEVGCGTGAILSGLTTRAVVHGLDRELARLADGSFQVSGRHSSELIYVRAVRASG